MSGLLPKSSGRGSGARTGGRHLDGGIGGDLQSIVPPVDVEDVLHVAVAVHLTGKGGVGGRRYSEVYDILPGVAAGLQAKHHRTAAHRCSVEVSGDVLDLVTH